MLHACIYLCTFYIYRVHEVHNMTVSLNSVEAEYTESAKLW